ncbi:hypothetical protein R5R35_001864 [Gryllus longicercus]|uniref:CLIC N-terminal domain-containing protein n=1 Tax=Gryllus longicercus TaxID=2509291 RepID=A0AAN9VM91_9ORTH
MTERKSGVTLFVKAGWDGKALGACHQSQRVLMLAKLKFAAGVLPSLESIPVNVSRPPQVFCELGLRLRVPALCLGIDIEPIDVADDIVSSLEEYYPGGVLIQNEVTEATVATRDFFSRFCFFIRDVSKNSSHLESELHHLDDFLKSTDYKFLCGNSPSLLDCEVLPKLHQVRVASSGIKGYEIPSSFSSLWRYLHTAYSEPAFVESCPSDTEILLHWLEHVGESSSKLQKQLLTSYKKPPKYSFSVPVFARCAVVE